MSQRKYCAPVYCCFTFYGGDREEEESEHIAPSRILCTHGVHPESDGLKNSKMDPVGRRNIRFNHRTVFLARAFEDINTLEELLRHESLHIELHDRDVMDKQRYVKFWAFYPFMGSSVGNGEGGRGGAERGEGGRGNTGAPMST